LNARNGMVQSGSVEPEHKPIISRPANHETVG
jgi:hypothetical protein